MDFSEDPDYALLSSETLNKASIAGNELAWHLEDVPSVVQDARQKMLATVGGQAQFRFPDGTCELYWVNVDATERKQNEPWNDYVNRSADEFLNMFNIVIPKTDFLQEAKDFGFVQEKIQNENINPLDYLVFVIYFNTEKTLESFRSE